eukprot:scaffold16044_cov67-Phaeocystis_antarctica.AAC.8
MRGSLPLVVGARARGWPRRHPGVAAVVAIVDEGRRAGHRAVGARLRLRARHRLGLKVRVVGPCGRLRPHVTHRVVEVRHQLTPAVVVHGLDVLGGEALVDGGVAHEAVDVVALLRHRPRHTVAPAVRHWAVPDGSVLRRGPGEVPAVTREERGVDSGDGLVRLVHEVFEAHVRREDALRRAARPPAWVPRKRSGVGRLRRALCVIVVGPDGPAPHGRDLGHAWVHLDMLPLRLPLCHP